MDTSKAKNPFMTQADLATKPKNPFMTQTGSDFADSPVHDIHQKERAKVRLLIIPGVLALLIGLVLVFVLNANSPTNTLEGNTSGATIVLDAKSIADDVLSDGVQRLGSVKIVINGIDQSELIQNVPIRTLNAQNPRDIRFEQLDYFERRGQQTVLVFKDGSTRVFNPEELIQLPQDLQYRLAYNRDE